MTARAGDTILPTEQGLTRLVTVFSCLAATTIRDLSVTADGRREECRHDK